MREVRVRFAPSPTGALHLGGVRTALFNYLFARKHNGKFILRIEDTDQTRFVPGAEEYIIKSLAWIGLDIDESDLKGGEYGPYKQSNRKHLYTKYALELVEKGFAYYAFDTPEELEAMRKKLEAEKASVQSYGPKTRMSMKNSLTMPADEVKKLLAENTPYVIRFKMPEDEKLVLKDIIRGEEWLPSLPLHFLLYRSFGWLDTMPEFAHLPLILKPDGKGKLSKRDGDRLGFPVFPLHWEDPKTAEVSKGYEEAGYFPEAFLNMMALLGWNPGNTTQEIFSKEELCQLFSLEKVSKAGAKFDPEKNKWFNKQYLERKTNEELAEYFIEDAKKDGVEVDKKRAAEICGLVKDRCHFSHDLWKESTYFFIAPDSYNEANVKKFWKEDSGKILMQAWEVIKDETDFSAKNLEDKLSAWINANGLNFGKVLNPMRLVLAGECKGPHIFDILEQLGKENVLKRLEKGVKILE